MRRLILFVLLLTATLAVWGQTGVNFEALTFGEALSNGFSWIVTPPGADLAD